MRAVDSATKRREVADFDRPAPSEAGTSPPGSRTERLNLRVETFDQHLVHRPFAEPILADRALPAWQRAFLAVKPRTRGRSTAILPPWKPILPFVRPQRCARRPSSRA